MSRVVLAMSGGVDSSVAAHLLCQAGHEVIGVFMRHGGESPVATSCNAGGVSVKDSLPIVDSRLDHKQGCCSAADAEDGRRVADRLGIPFYALNLQEEFGRIIDYFVDEYSDGRTPNPCVMCNNWIKFGKLFDYADSAGAEYVATGHYARLRLHASENTTLHRGLDDSKDQSYVLFGVQRPLLSRMMLPVGDFRKSQIRKMAADLGLRVAQKRDSQEICFVTSGKHDQFVRQRRDDSETAGEIVTTDGKVVGQHAGIECFTIGQRKGLGVAFGEPRFVVRIDAETKQIVVGKKAALGRTKLTAADTNWLADVPDGPIRCLAQIRYNSPAAPATMQRLSERSLSVNFDEPQYGVAPGQALVCFEGDQVLGGGWIES